MSWTTSKKSLEALPRDRTIESPPTLARSVETAGDLPLTCVLSQRALPRHGAAIRCARAVAEVTEYPTIGDVRLLIPAASALVAGTHASLDAKRAAFEAQGDEPPTLFAASAERTAERYRALRDAERCNLELLERHCTPLADYLREGRPIAKGLASTLTFQLSGWTAQALLPYFYQDWGDTPAFAAVRARIEGAVARHVGARGTVAVLGCGAGGLVHALAPHFRAVIGADLSLPSLLLARHLLDGGAMRLAVHTENPWMPDFPLVSVGGARDPRPNTTLIAANAADLPLADGSVACVVTQYLLDIVPDAAAVAEEVHRILADDGVWINFGCPFKLASDPAALRARTERDMPAFLDGFGFALLETESLRHDHLDLAALTPHAIGGSHPITFFAGRKREPSVARPVVAAFSAYFSGDEAPLFGLVPRRRARQPMLYMVGSETRSGTSRTAALFSVGTQKLSTVRAPVSTPPMMSALVHGYLQRLDGEATVAEVFRDLHLETSGLLAEEDFVLGLRLMRNLGWVDLA